MRDREEAARISNAYAPEHLIINVEDAEAWLPLLDNAGSIFMGRCARRRSVQSAVSSVMLSALLRAACAPRVLLID